MIHQRPPDCADGAKCTLCGCAPGEGCISFAGNMVDCDVSYTQPRPATAWLQYCTEIRNSDKIRWMIGGAWIWTLIGMSIFFAVGYHRHPRAIVLSVTVTVLIMIAAQIVWNRL